MGTGSDAGDAIARFRALLATNYMAGIFRAPDDLASQVAAASAQGLFPLCAEFLSQLRKGEASSDTRRETDRQVLLWNQVHEPPAGPGENMAKVGVRAELLERWLGERLVTRCLRVDQQGLTMAQVQ